MHGAVSAVPTEDFPDYSANFTLAKCDQSRIPGTLLTYTPQAEYSGVDQFSYRIFFPNGHEMIVNSTVNIQP
jgi:hypothetical protein